MCCECTHTLTYSLQLSHMPTLIFTNWHIHEHSHIKLTWLPTYVLTCTSSHHTHSHSFTPIHTHTHSHAPSHAYTHRNIHCHAYTLHTHTHTCLLPSFPDTKCKQGILCKKCTCCMRLKPDNVHFQISTHFPLQTSECLAEASFCSAAPFSWDVWISYS